MVLAIIEDRTVSGLPVDITEKLRAQVRVSEIPAIVVISSASERFWSGQWLGSRQRKLGQGMIHIHDPLAIVTSRDDIAMRDAVIQ